MTRSSFALLLVLAGCPSGDDPADASGDTEVADTEPPDASDPETDVTETDVTETDVTETDVTETDVEETCVADASTTMVAPSLDTRAAKAATVCSGPDCGFLNAADNCGVGKPLAILRRLPSDLYEVQTDDAVLTSDQGSVSEGRATDLPADTDVHLTWGEDGGGSMTVRFSGDQVTVVSFTLP